MTDRNVPPFMGDAFAVRLVEANTLRDFQSACFVGRYFLPDKTIVISSPAVSDSCRLTS